MKINRFLSSKNAFTVSILWGVVVILIFLLVLGFRDNNIQFAPMLILGLVAAMIIWILFDTRYVIKNSFLLFRSGPFRGRIDINKIRKIEFYSGLYPQVMTKPGLGAKGFIISYNNYDDVYITPRNRKDFINELLKINPKIEFIQK
jgi:hypothetical protein